MPSATRALAWSCRQGNPRHVRCGMRRAGPPAPCPVSACCAAGRQSFSSLLLPWCRCCSCRQAAAATVIGGGTLQVRAIKEGMAAAEVQEEGGGSGVQCAGRQICAVYCCPCAARATPHAMSRAYAPRVELYAPRVTFACRAATPRHTPAMFTFMFVCRMMPPIRPP